jgi:pyruvate,water dikinase
MVIRNGVIEEASLPAVELTHYQGIGCSPGKTVGILGEIRDPNLAVVSEINIFPNASPEYTPHFKQSHGIIFETGSPLAHGAIVARELKIPAIILSIDFRSLIGKQVTIDGTQGTVTVVE